MLQKAGVDRPLPLVALMFFVVLQAVAVRTERRMKRSLPEDVASPSVASEAVVTGSANQAEM
jgi:hypothetical protein